MPMLKIFNAEQIKACDAATIHEENIPSIELMERACHAFVTWFTEKVDATRKIGIVCGTGNNGGDGLGIARLLKDWGYHTKVWIVRAGPTVSADFAINFKKFQDVKGEIIEIEHTPDEASFIDRDVLIDAIFGTGLSRPLEGIYAQVVQFINQTKAYRIAVDVPSGLALHNALGGPIVKADYTISFQFPKLPFLFPSYHEYVGQWVLVDIGLSKKFIREEKSFYHYSTSKAIKKLLKARSPFDHKGRFGHGLLLAGSYGKMGAALLSAKAALRGGLGLLTVHTPKCGYIILQTAVPEAMVSIDEDEFFLFSTPKLNNIDALGIGPGLGQHQLTIKLLSAILQNFDKPVVMDADALNILSNNRELLHVIPRGSILTPHPKEFERLVGKWADDFERLQKQRSLSEQLQVVVVLKGANTSIACPNGNVYFNSTGNPGMATAGSGDVLTGLLLGLLAQGYTAEEAAVLGVYVHGLAGDFANLEKGEESMIASDVIEHLAQAFKHLKR